MILIGCYGSGQTPENGLRIENGINRGLNYTDAQKIKYSYRYIPITITNDSTTAIHVQIALSNKYNYPAAYGDQQFKVFLLPKELTTEKVTWDSITYELGNNELREFFEKDLNLPYVLNETLDPGEKCDITIGTLYPRPTNCGILPNALFIKNNDSFYKKCDSLKNQDLTFYSRFALGVKLDFCKEDCFVIPCGQISYPER